MRKMLIACSLGLAAIAGSVTMPAWAGRTYHSTLDRGEPIGSVWSRTKPFTKVTLAGSDDVVLTRGGDWRIRATATPKVLAELRFRIEDGALLVGRRSTREPVPGKARIEVTAPSLEAVDLAGSGALAVDAMNGESGAATVAGSGSITVDRLDVASLSATIAGSGDLRLRGRAGRASITIAGSGDLDGTRLQIGHAEVSIAGSGDASFGADGDVSASIVGSGDVTVTGTTRCAQSRTGSGRLRCSK